MTKSVRSLFFMLVIASFVLAACGGAATATEAPVAESTSAPAEPTAAPAEPTAASTEEDTMAMYAPDAVSGEIITAGSSTVFPLSERMKQRFEEEGFTGNLTVDSIGSGAGIERFCVAGETDIANASRAIRDTEIESCKGIGRTPVEFQVGIDALAVTVSAENDFVDDVTIEELALIYSTATNWSDVRPDWPNEPILRFSPGTDSGTFDYFVEAVMAEVLGDTGEAAILESANTQFSEDDNVLVQGVEGSPYAIGYFGYAYFQENQGSLKALSVNGVEPNAETAESGDYPISRPLFIYSDATIMQEKPQVASFIYFYLNNVTDEILDVGYFPVSEAKAEENLNAWKAALGIGEAPAAANDEMAMYAPDAVTGDIITAGSSTVFPLSERMKQRFEEEGFAGNLTVDSIGSGAGIERFCVAGETDIANSSRAIRDTEIESCTGIGRTVVEFQVGIDALALVVSSENDFVEDVTTEELALIYSTATNWSDVRPEWPNEPILRFSPGTDSGTFDYFVEAVMASIDDDATEDVDEGEVGILESAGTQFSEDDNVLVQGVQGSPYAIGYFGYAYYQENASTLKALSVDGVEPTAETAESGEYPISRPLFIYSSTEIMQEKPQVASFIYFYLNNVANEILDVGYFPVSDGKAQENLDTWNAAISQ